MTFNDLVFKAPADKAFKHTPADLLFPNGYGIRVVHFPPNYEICVTVGGRPVFNTPIGDMVHVRATPAEVEELMGRIAGL